jgi:hypothetical protein
MVLHHLASKPGQDGGEEVSGHHPFSIGNTDGSREACRLLGDANLPVVRTKFDLGVPKPHLEGVALFLQAVKLSDQVEDLKERQILGVLDYFQRNYVVRIREIKNEIITSQGSRGPEKQCQPQ